MKSYSVFSVSRLALGTIKLYSVMFLYMRQYYTESAVFPYEWNATYSKVDTVPMVTLPWVSSQADLASVPLASTCCATPCHATPALLTQSTHLWNGTHLHHK